MKTKGVRPQPAVFACEAGAAFAQDSQLKPESLNKRGKKTMRFKLSVLAPLALCLSLTANAQQQYNIVDLGTLGGTVTVAYGLNNKADATGFAYAADAGCYLQTFLYTEANGLSDIGLQSGFGGCNLGVSINDAGQISFDGDHHTGSGDYTAHRYTPGVGAIDLGALPGDTVSYAGRIDAVGDVVGGSIHGDGTGGDAFLYTDALGMVDLGNLGGVDAMKCGGAIAVGINATGTIVGSARTPNTPPCEYWDRGDAFVDYNRRVRRMVDLNTIIRTKGWNLRTAAAINKKGFIVGYGATMRNNQPVLDAFRYNPATRRVTDLGTFVGGGISYAEDINSRNWIVGAAYLDGSGSGNYRAALWQPGRPGAQDLDNLIPPNTGWTLREAYGINDKGQIVGWGYVAGGDTHAFRLDPVAR